MEINSKSTVAEATEALQSERQLKAAEFPAPASLWVGQKGAGGRFVKVTANTVVHEHKHYNNDVEYVRADTFSALCAERDKLLQTLETRAEREQEMIKGICEENDALRAAISALVDVLRRVIPEGEPFDMPPPRGRCYVMQVPQAWVIKARAALAVGEVKEGTK